jgi:hypothetical protein
MTNYRRILSAPVEELSASERSLRLQCLKLLRSDPGGLPQNLQAELDRALPEKSKPIDYVGPVVEVAPKKYHGPLVIAPEAPRDAFSHFTREAPARNVHSVRTNAFEAIPIAPRSTHRAPAAVEAAPLVEAYLANGGAVQVCRPRLSRQRRSGPSLSPRPISPTAERSKSVALERALAKVEQERSQIEAIRTTIAQARSEIRSSPVSSQPSKRLRSAAVQATNLAACLAFVSARRR